MPHDLNGKLLVPGDKVLVPCTIENVTQTEDNLYCNVTLKTDHPMPPYTHKDTITLNTKQVIKAE